MRWESRLELLRQLASAAHVAAKHGWYVDADLAFAGGHPMPEDVARYLAHCCPSDVLALLDERDQLAAVVERVRDALGRADDYEYVYEMAEALEDALPAPPPADDGRPL